LTAWERGPAVTFAFIGEGPSDAPLVPVLRELVIDAGARVATGVPRAYKGTSSDKLDAFVKDGAAEFDLVFLHRDADAPDHVPRRREVERAFAAHGLHGVPVVPVQETEAWLLVDEQAIRDVVGRSGGRSRLDLPAVRRIEQVRDPKEILVAACLAAGDTSGRRREREKKRFGQYRRDLLERLDPNGPVSGLESFRRLVTDVRQAVTTIAEAAR
jgi:hypothetical protein